MDRDANSRSSFAMAAIKSFKNSFLGEFPQSLGAMFSAICRGDLIRDEPNDSACFLRYALDFGADGVQSGIDVLVASVDLLDVVDGADSFGAEGGDEQGYTGANIGRCHGNTAQRHLAIEPDDGGAVRIAEDDLRAHVDEFIDEKQSAFEHFLVNQYRAFGLGGHHENDAQQVGGESGPRMVGNGHDGAVDVAVDGVSILGGD